MRIYTIDMVAPQFGTFTLLADHDFNPALPVGAQFGHIKITAFAASSSQMPGYVAYDRAAVQRAVEANIEFEEKHLRLAQMNIATCDYIIDVAHQECAQALAARGALDPKVDASQDGLSTLSNVASTVSVDAFIKTYNIKEDSLAILAHHQENIAFAKNYLSILQEYRPDLVILKFDRSKSI